MEKQQLVSSVTRSADFCGFLPPFIRTILFEADVNAARVALVRFPSLRLSAEAPSVRSVGNGKPGADRRGGMNASSGDGVVVECHTDHVNTDHGQRVAPGSV